MATQKAQKDQEHDDPTPKLSQSEQLSKYKGRYTPYITETGTSMDNGDEIAAKLRGAAPDVVVRLAEKLKGLEPGALATKYDGLNPGSRRMNAGNIVRGFIKRGDATIEDVTKRLKEANKEIHTA